MSQVPDYGLHRAQYWSAISSQVALRGHEGDKRYIWDLHSGGSNIISGRSKPRSHDTQQRSQPRLQPRTDAHQIRGVPLVRYDRLTCRQISSAQRAQAWSAGACCDSLTHPQCLEAYSLVTVRELMGYTTCRFSSRGDDKLCVTGQSAPTPAQPAGLLLLG